MKAVLMRRAGEQVRGLLCIWGTEEGWCVGSTGSGSTKEWDPGGAPGLTGK